MKIFLSWSGPRSRAVAEALSTWIPRVIQAVDVFFSPDIEKGAKWGNEITDALEGTSFGIVVITRDNLTSPWLHYEAGALSKLQGARVWTFLLDLANADVPPPLGLFQHTEANQEDVLKLLRSINVQVREGGEKALADAVLSETFEDLWPRFSAQVDLARALELPDDLRESSLVRATHGRTEREMLEELLELVRGQQRRAAQLPMAGGDRTHRILEEASDTIGVRYENLVRDVAIGPVRHDVGLAVADWIQSRAPGSEFQMRSTARRGRELIVRLSRPLHLAPLQVYAEEFAGSSGDPLPTVRVLAVPDADSMFANPVLNDDEQSIDPEDESRSRNAGADKPHGSPAQ